ncbi:hypothetical protein OC25_05905 [Pedobacter kyungheensis]|uniref:DUF2306 domain-containing protein n=2 Tax=Pedobacter kyungheensis TaxID=1069985 RepID=A0A0C1G5H6_9SPHI|nr:hypothetical protein OC25_05905 [Pedobacter kyungheensis]
MLLAIITYLMLIGIIRYYPLRDDIGFLQFKQEYLDILPWKIAFYTHVFTIIFALLAGFTQFSTTILAKHKRLHRIMGKIYVYDIFLNFPVAFVMGIYANGLLPTKMAFILLDCLWVWFTYRAVVEIKSGHVSRHKEFMIRSYALTLSAVSLRFWKIVILSFVQVDPLPLYMINAWLGFVPNLLFAEWLIRKRRRKLTFKANIVQD